MTKNTTTTASKGYLKEALKAHKVAKRLPWGISVKEALALGLMDDTGAVNKKAAKKALKAAKAAKASAKTAKVTKVSASKAHKSPSKKAKPEGLSFPQLRVALKAHKDAEMLPTGMTVMQALDAGLMDRFGNLLVGDETKVTAVVADVKPERKAKVSRPTKREVSEEHVARVAPRRANGTIAPKSEWALREKLADTGQFDRYEIDDIVAAKFGANA